MIISTKAVEHSTDFDRALHCKKMSLYCSLLIKYYNDVRTGKSCIPPEIPEILYGNFCSNIHEYYDNSSNFLSISEKLERKRCVNCGFMMIVDNCGINLPDEIVAKIICTTNVFHGLLISKSIKKESEQYAIPLVIKNTFMLKEYKIATGSFPLE